MNKSLKKQVFSISTEEEFERTALQVFNYQAHHCVVYKEFINRLGVNVSAVRSISDIPFLPISLFKSQAIVSSHDDVEITFVSSGTTGTITSRHHVTDISWYVDSFRKAFKRFYGDIKQYTILALLPSYLEREGSSLIYMIDDLIKTTERNGSGYYLYNHADLYHKLKKQQEFKKPTMLIGVTFALLNFVELYQLNFPELIVLETGGMKGRRKEMIRAELHQALSAGFGVNNVHSEYGMTELLSQAYSRGNGIYQCPPWMRVLTRDTNDPLSLLNDEKTGGINIIDLANINSCSFIATQDLGRVYADNTFEILGRFNDADIRGCNMLIA